MKTGNDRSGILYNTKTKIEKPYSTQLLDNFNQMIIHKLTVTTISPEWNVTKTVGQILKVKTLMYHVVRFT